MPIATVANTSPLGMDTAEAEAYLAARMPGFAEALAAEPPYEEIGQKVAVARSLRGLTQTELGKLVRTSHSQISRIESGYHLPDVLTLDRLGRALGIEFTLPLAGVDPSRVDRTLAAAGRAARRALHALTTRAPHRESKKMRLAGVDDR